MKINIEPCDQPHCGFDPQEHKGDRVAVLILFYDEDGMGVCKHHAQHAFDMPVNKMLTASNIMHELAKDFVAAALEKDEEKVYAIAINQVIEEMMESIVPPVNPDEAN